MTLRDRIESAPDKLAAARVAINEAWAVVEAERVVYAYQSPLDSAIHRAGDAIRALRDSLGGDE
jgi:hypothetical protein